MAMLISIQPHLLLMMLLSIPHSMLNTHHLPLAMLSSNNPTITPRCYCYTHRRCIDALPSPSSTFVVAAEVTINSTQAQQRVWSSTPPYASSTHIRPLLPLLQL
jgi:hypothetical protein